MANHVRFGAFVREISVRQDQISYNALNPPRFDAEGRPIPQARERVRFRGIDVYRLVEPYVRVRLLDQLRAVVPLAAYLALFQIVVLRQDVEHALTISAGLIAVIIGLTFFTEGLAVGLMPFGETIGHALPAKSPLPIVLFVAFVLGIGTTFAEPAIGALQAAGSRIDPREAPLVYALLTSYSLHLVLLVGVGVGFAAALGAIRFIYSWGLKPIVYSVVVPLIGLTAVFSSSDSMNRVLGLAWDCGAVTTGPVTVPLVLALGIGIAHAAGKGEGPVTGFGIVTLASLFPVLAVLGLALFVSATNSPQEIIAAAEASVSQTSSAAWYESTPYIEITLGIRAIVPLVLFLGLVLVLLRERVREPKHIAYGIVLAVLGMCVFNLGLTYGLSQLGGQTGGLIPGAFTTIAGFEGSPLYATGAGLAIAIGFAWILGFSATLAEPALNAMGRTVESLTSGAFRKRTLMYAVSFGVGAGISLGVAKLIFAIPLPLLLIPGYAIALVLTFFSTDEFVNIAWDCAGVTTGPVTVPLVLSMGLGLGNAVGAIEGFGILSMASIGPIIAVLSTGLWIQFRIHRRHEQIESMDEAKAA